MGRPRIDLDGVTLLDAASPNRPLAVFRYRTVRGLVLLIPESGDFVVAWEHVASSTLDLAQGELLIRFTPEFAAKSHWLGGATALRGRWIDRHTMA